MLCCPFSNAVQGVVFVFHRLTLTLNPLNLNLNLCFSKNRYLLTRHARSLPASVSVSSLEEGLPVNNATYGIAAGLAEAFKAYNR